MVNNMFMSSPLEKMYQAMKAEKISEAELSRLINETPQTINNWKRRGTLPASQAPKIAKALNLDLNSLMDKQKPILFLNKSKNINEKAGLYNTIEAGSELNEVWLISWVQAGNWNEIIDNYHPGDGEKPILISKKTGKRSFALRVEGDSMVNSGIGDSFPPGTIVIIDPDRQPQNGSYVIVRLDDDKQATFKQLVIDGGKQYLKPLNDRYPIMEINGPATICGVVRASMNEYD